MIFISLPAVNTVVDMILPPVVSVSAIWADAAYPKVAFAQTALMVPAHVAARPFPVWNDRKRLGIVSLVFVGFTARASYLERKQGRCTCVRCFPESSQSPSTGISAAVFHPESCKGARGRGRIEGALTRTHGRTQRPERGVSPPLGTTGASRCPHASGRPRGTPRTVNRELGEWWFVWIKK